MPASDNSVPHIVVLGAGFGGLEFCRRFRGPARITLVDRTNHHLFQPLLYQVAMAGLSAPEVAEPTRSIFRGRDQITVLMDEVQSIDLGRHRVRLCNQDLAYDYLVVALGGMTTWFGNPDWEHKTLGLKSLRDAMDMRAHLLTSFEYAENCADEEERRRLMTIVIVGGGPTGVELAGSMAELTRIVFRRDFRRINPADTRIVLVQSKDYLLPEYPKELCESARKQLEGLGVEVVTGQRVVEVHDDRVKLKNGETIGTKNVLWAAGVQASPVAKSLGVELDRGGRIFVREDLSVPGHPEVFAIGDIVNLKDADGVQVPGVAPAAIQMGRHVAKQITAEVADRIGRDDREPFVYLDKGMMATIGRSRAVAWIRHMKLSGFPAWLAWSLVHLVFLIGFRNKVAVLLSWFYAYAVFRRGARIIIGPRCGPPQLEDVDSTPRDKPVTPATAPEDEKALADARARK